MAQRDIRSLYFQHREQFLGNGSVVGVGIGAKAGSKPGVPPEHEIVVLAWPRVEFEDLILEEGSQKELEDIVLIRPPDLTIPQLGAERRGPICDGSPDFSMLNAPKLHSRRRPPTKSRQAASIGYRSSEFPEIFVIGLGSDLVVPVTDTEKTIDWVGAFQLLRDSVGDLFDFVLFNLDGDLQGELPSYPNHALTVFNDIEGIGHREGAPFDERELWGSEKLQAVQCTNGWVDNSTVLHETAHRWLAYGAQELDHLHQNNIDSNQRLWHWGCCYDNDRSCMDYDRMDWLNAGEVAKDQESARYSPQSIGRTVEFSPLDRYLMGFMEIDDLPPVRYFPLETLCTEVEEPCEPSYMTRDEILEVLGPRVPDCDNSQRCFRQAFVFLTSPERASQPEQIRGWLEHLEKLRTAHERYFRDAVQREACVMTRLTCGTNEEREIDMEQKKRHFVSVEQSGEPVELVKVKIKNTTTKPKIVRFKALGDPVSPEGQDSEVIDLNNGVSIPPGGEAAHTFTGDLPKDISQVQFCAEAPFEDPEHWVCTLADDEPYGMYPRSIYGELTEYQLPLARGFWIWMLQVDDAKLETPPRHLNTVVDGPHPGCQI